MPLWVWLAAGIAIWYFLNRQNSTSGTAGQDPTITVNRVNGRCETPLPEGEVARIAGSVARYAPRIEATEFAGTDFADFKPLLDDAYVVKGAISRESLVGFIGGTGTGKTFFAADLALHIALGRAWRGHPVRRGFVLYLALENMRSAINRFCALRQVEKVDAAPLTLTGGPINLRDPQSVEAVLTLVRQREHAFGRRAPRCSSTRSRARWLAATKIERGHGGAGGGRRYAARRDRRRRGAGHHLGKDEGRGARGHSLLRAALDTEFTISGNEGVRTAIPTKQRDYPLGQRYAFELAPAVLGIDQDGEAVEHLRGERLRRATGGAPERQEPTVAVSGTAGMAARSGGPVRDLARRAGGHFHATEDHPRSAPRGGQGARREGCP